MCPSWAGTQPLRSPAPPLAVSRVPPRTEEDGPLLSVKQIRFTRGASRDAGDGDGAQGGGYESQCPTS
eukprot:1157807-Pelagomonas_calceolata.AAC.7